MKLSDLMKRAEKRHEIGGGDYVTLLRIPTRVQMQIDRSRFKGLKLTELAEAVQGQEIAATDNAAMLKLLGKNPDLLDGYDGGYQADLETLVQGIHPEKHSLTDDDGKVIALDRGFYERLYIANEALFNSLADAQKAYQTEMSLGEQTGS